MDEVVLCKECGDRPAKKNLTLCEVCHNRGLQALKVGGYEPPEAKYERLMRETGRKYDGSRY